MSSLHRGFRQRDFYFESLLSENPAGTAILNAARKESCNAISLYRREFVPSPWGEGAGGEA